MFGVILLLLYAAYGGWKYREEIRRYTWQQKGAAVFVFIGLIAIGTFLIYVVGNRLVAFLPWQWLQLVVFFVIVVLVLYPIRFVLAKTMVRIFHLSEE
ncbi:hypothetical protein QRD89_18545 [Halobacillus sp. ACCC02827]|uniref:hypothetical protein n=1 Tax=Halobacillus sp. ACCC02827 TaxID=3052090 RepID=UPI002570D407|nr:hypothetical protein [Halobacillus sp. ACCC02827]WJE15695.1 hypothetical protein QRD89_18545 [Halobacillus sp. ACCC02827]